MRRSGCARGVVALMNGPRKSPLQAIAYGLDADDARDLRTLINERLGGESGEPASADALIVSPGHEPACGDLRVHAPHEMFGGFPCYGLARPSEPQRVFVSVVFPDDEAMSAARISLIGVHQVAPLDRPEQLIIPIELDGDLVDFDESISHKRADIACRFCFDYLHGPTDAHPELAGTLWDSVGDDGCVARPLDDGGLVQPHVPFDVPAGQMPCGCLNDADAHRVGCPLYPEGREGS